MTYERVAISSFAKLQSGFAFKSRDWQDEGVPVIRIKNVKDGRLEMEGCAYVSDEVASSAAAFRLSRGDLLLTMTGDVGERALVRSSDWMMLNQRVGRFSFLEGAEDQVDSIFFYYALAHPEVFGDIRRRAYGAAQPNISGAAVGEVEVYLPSLPIQQRIAAILSAYDDLIETNTRRIAILEEMARRLYEEWFVHFRFPGNDQVDYDGELPDGWLHEQLGEVLSLVRSGGTPARKDPGYWSGGEIDWYKTGELWDGFLLGSSEQITQEAIRQKKGRIFPESTIFMAIYGSPTVGRLGVTTAECSCNQATIALRPRVERMTFWYLYYTLLFLRSEFNAKAQGAAQQNISKEKVVETSALLPPLPLQQAFEANVSPLKDTVLNLSRKNANLRAQRDLLLPKLVSGEIDVSKAEAALEAAE